MKTENYTCILAYSPGLELYTRRARREDTLYNSVYSITGHRTADRIHCHGCERTQIRIQISNTEYNEEAKRRPVRT